MTTAFGTFLSRLKGSRFIKFGIPFFTIVFGGALGLTEFSKIRYEHRKQVTLSPEDLKAMGISMKPPEDVTIEKEFERIQDMDIDTWENKRGPRPWEDDTLKQLPAKS